MCSGREGSWRFCSLLICSRQKVVNSADTCVEHNCITMGKSRTNKNKVHHENANYPNVTMKEEHADSESHEVSGKKEPVSKIIKALATQLQSSSVEDRDCACNALTNLIRNSNFKQSSI